MKGYTIKMCIGCGFVGQTSSNQQHCPECDEHLIGMKLNGNPLVPLSNSANEAMKYITRATNKPAELVLQEALTLYRMLVDVRQINQVQEVEAVQ